MLPFVGSDPALPETRREAPALARVVLPRQGFGSAHYAGVLSEFGTPAPLGRSGGWFLRRGIADFPDADGVGAYPFLVCRDWSRLPEDLESAGAALVSFAAVPDPFGEYNLDLLRRCFPDVCVHFKDHFVADLLQPLEKIVSKHRRRYARKALRRVEVELCA